MTVKEFCRALEENPGVKVRSQEAKQRKGCIVCPFRTCVLAFLLGLIGLAFPVLPVAIAEILPTSGTFTGYYHRDTLGVGHFGFFFLVAPELHAQLAKYDGKLIRLEVTKGVEPINPGGAMIQEIGTITELGPLPFVLSVRTHPSPVIAGRPFIVRITMTDTRPNNANDDAVELRPESPEVRFLQAPQNPRPDAHEPSIFPGYTRGHFYCEAASGLLGAALLPVGTVWPNLEVSNGDISLVPGESWTWVAHYPAGVARVDGEVHIRSRCQTPGFPTGDSVDLDHVPIDVWQSVKVIADTAPTTRPAISPAEPLLRIDHLKISPAAADGWCDLQFRLRPAEGKTVLVPAGVSPSNRNEALPETLAAIAQLDGFDAGGSRVPLDVKRKPAANDHQAMRARMMELPADGIVIDARFKKTSRFAPALTRLVVSFVTEEDVQTVTLTDRYRDTDIAPATPFGPVAEGVKIRIRPSTPRVAAGASLGFFMQAENVSGKPIVWRKSVSGYGINAVIEIDGKPIDLPAEAAQFTGGWAAKHTVQFPNERVILLPEELRLTQGRHTLRYIIEGDGGTYMNASEEPIPMLNGRLISNQVTFEVVPADREASSNAQPTAE